jgi:K+ transporter
MIIDNQKTVIRVFLRKMLIAIITVVIIVAILATNWFKPELLGITQYQWIVLVAAIYILLVVGSWLRGLNYFFFNDQGDKLIIRYYPIRPLGRTKKAVQIPKTALAKYEIVKTNLGLKKVLILHQHVKKNVAKYPPIGVTSLTREELSRLEQQLSSYVRD